MANVGVRSEFGAQRKPSTAKNGKNSRSFGDYYDLDENGNPIGAIGVMRGAADPVGAASIFSALAQPDERSMGVIPFNAKASFDPTQQVVWRDPRNPQMGVYPVATPAAQPVVDPEEALRLAEQRNQIIEDMRYANTQRINSRPKVGYAEDQLAARKAQRAKYQEYASKRAAERAADPIRQRVQGQAIALRGGPVGVPILDNPAAAGAVAGAGGAAVGGEHAGVIANANKILQYGLATGNKELAALGTSILNQATDAIGKASTVAANEASKAADRASQEKIAKMQADTLLEKTNPKAPEPAEPGTVQSSVDTDNRAHELALPAGGKDLYDRIQADLATMDMGDPEKALQVASSKGWTPARMSEFNRYDPRGFWDKFPAMPPGLPAAQTIPQMLFGESPMDREQRLKARINAEELLRLMTNQSAIK